MPNAGKSSLLAALTRAKPKIANYPFTTLDPNLGVAYFNNKEVILADIPGLVEGAHKGVGLGDKFLRHVERCKVLLHLIDITEKNLLDNYKKISHELFSYNKNLLKKKEIIIFNKSDMLDKKQYKEKEIYLKNKIGKKFEIISVFNNKDLSKIKKVLIQNVAK